MPKYFTSTLKQNRSIGLQRNRTSKKSENFVYVIRWILLLQIVWGEAGGSEIGQTAMTGCQLLSSSEIYGVLIMLCDSACKFRRFIYHWFLAHYPPPSFRFLSLSKFPTFSQILIQIFFYANIVYNATMILFSGIKNFINLYS